MNGLAKRLLILHVMKLIYFIIFLHADNMRNLYSSYEKIMIVLSIYKQWRISYFYYWNTGCNTLSQPYLSVSQKYAMMCTQEETIQFYQLWIVYRAFYHSWSIISFILHFVKRFYSVRGNSYSTLTIHSGLYMNLPSIVHFNIRDSERLNQPNRTLKFIVLLVNGPGWLCTISTRRMPF